MSQEGGLRAPERHPVRWEDPSYLDREAIEKEAARVFDVCHGCRRCFNLCQAFPLLFDAIDATPNGEVAELDRAVSWKVAEECYLCDLCFMTKCPYVPPHPFAIDFPKLMLRAKAARHEERGLGLRNRLLSSTDAVGRILGVPVVAPAVNALARRPFARRFLESTIGIDREEPLPPYASRSLRARLAKRTPAVTTPTPGARTSGKVGLFVTCYANHNEPSLAEDLIAVFEHNGIVVDLVDEEVCCGMPRLEHGDLASVVAHARKNLPALARLVDRGYELTAPVPSCVLMFRRELPLLLPDDPLAAKVAQAFRDPFEYLMLRARDGLLLKDFVVPLGEILYHAPCHQRVQNVGPRTREFLELVPETTVTTIERCSGHDGTYAVRRETHAHAVAIGRPVFARVREAPEAVVASDCPMAGRHIAWGGEHAPAVHPLRLAAVAYGLAPPEGLRPSSSAEAS
jgi:glycerol-3-phosphate dehydrogenase subunit C